MKQARKRFTAFLTAGALWLCRIGVSADPQTKENDALQLTAPAAVLMEVSTGQLLYQKNADEQRSPASITKIMTLLLIFEELEKGKLKLSDPITTSAHAKSMGGSQVFLEEGEQQTAETMIKCIVIASGNDAAVAMAEHIGGNESSFVEKMNQKAAALGMEHTHFEDCCGLTDSPGHYTSAGDVALMSRELVQNYPQILTYSSIWLEDITHVTRQGSKNFTLANTNKLLRAFEGCKGLKTGSTSTAKYCLSAAAERNDITLLAVVLGAPDSKARFREAAELLNYGFSNCSLYIDEKPGKLNPIPVTGAVQPKVKLRFGEKFRYLDTTGASFSDIEKKQTLPKTVKAPIKKGAQAGVQHYLLNGKEIGSIPILYAEAVSKATYRDYLKKIWKLYLQGV